MNKFKKVFNYKNNIYLIKIISSLNIIINIINTFGVSIVSWTPFN